MQKQYCHSLFLKGFIEEIEIHKITIPNFISRETNLIEIDELVPSIRQHGLIHPIVVRIKDDHFEIVAGMRRYLAFKKLGWRKILAHIMEIDDRMAFEICLVENIQRKRLNPIEESRAFKSYVSDFGWGGVSDLAFKISKSKSYVCKRLLLLDLPAEILEGVQNYQLNSSVAEEIASVKDKEKQIEVFEQVINKNLTARETRELTKSTANSVYVFKQEDLEDSTNETDMAMIDHKVQRSFDKTISILKLTLYRMGVIIADMENNWMVYEMLMQHKNMINSQIDILIKQKKKLG